jgi:hypothetical protein
MVQGPGSKVHGPRSTADGPWSTVHGPRSTANGPRFRHCTLRVYQATVICESAPHFYHFSGSWPTTDGPRFTAHDRRLTVHGSGIVPSVYIRPQL